MLYLNLSTGSVLYGEDGKATEASNGNNPGLTFGDVITLGLQLLNTESVDETTGLYNNPYTGYAGKTVTASAVVDVDYKTETNATVATAIVAATPISTIDLTYTPAETPVRTHGKIYLGVDRTESVYYNNCVEKSAGVYTFTLSDNAYTTAAFTPTNGYTLASAAYVRTAALIAVPNSKFTITAATALFSMILDGANSILWDKIKNTASVADASLEVQIFVNGVRDHTIKVDFDLTGTMSLGDIEISNPSAQDFDQMDSRYTKIADLLKAFVFDSVTGRVTAIKLQGPGGQLFTQTVQADGSLFLPTTQDA